MIKTLRKLSEFGGEDPDVTQQMSKTKFNLRTGKHRIRRSRGRGQKAGLPGSNDKTGQIAAGSKAANQGKKTKQNDVAETCEESVKVQRLSLGADRQVSCRCG